MTVRTCAHSVMTAGTMDRMTAAEFAAWRHLLGLTLNELAEALADDPRTAFQVYFGGKKRGYLRGA